MSDRRRLNLPTGPKQRGPPNRETRELRETREIRETRETRGYRRHEGSRGRYDDYGSYSRRDNSRGGMERDRRYNDRGRSYGDREWDRDDHNGNVGTTDHDDYFTKRDTFTPEELEHAISIDKRDRSGFTLWDKKPKELGELGAEKAKLLGLFPLPGSGKKPLDIQKMVEIIKNDNSKAILEENSLIDPKDALNARVIVVNNVKNALVDVILNYFKEFLSSLKVFEDVEIKIKSHQKRKSSLIVVFENYHIATIALALNGYIVHDDNEGIFTLELSRPNEYCIPVFNHHAEQLDNTQTFLKDSPSKITVSNIPINVDEQQLRIVIAEKVDSELMFVTILRDKEGTSKGIGFVEFKDPSVISKAWDSLKEVKIENQKLKWNISCIGNTSDSVMNFRQLIKASDGKQISQRHPTKVLQLLNMIDYSGLIKEQNYSNIERETKVVKFDVEKKIKSLEIEFQEVKVPQLSQKIDLKDQFHTIGKLGGFGKVFIKFNSIDDCESCYVKFNGTKYFDRTILVSYFSDEDFELGLF
ncbi:hypothetical protein DASC09_049460 [Saccharomycopsis crataegensis]|uniref:RRM domain-containing protein n=1 Tax=Saccharomycopsis crataegensis TaxID=43959 RepID=A0AAV5QST1_9ASCO|nr:hypothetical protein DASC09_049460 [Saccharomycopsis crataegensis]